jgi:hypothetical protein
MASGLFTLKQQENALPRAAWTAGGTTPLVEYLVVAGGGGAAMAGGGAGGFRTGYVPVVARTAYTVTVGAGGASGVNEVLTPATNGSDSVFGPITSTGGGKGGTWYSSSVSTVAYGAAGGSGGGSSGQQATASQINGGQGIAGQGNAGGDFMGNSSVPYMTSGGGGAGSAGSTTASVSNTANGGVGAASEITGTRTMYAGGGGGSAAQSGNTIYSTGGFGGGGSPNATTGNAGGAGTVNTGGGGGGGSPGGAGGSGVVAISYPDIFPAATATTGSPTISTSGTGSLSFPGGTGTNLYFNNGNSNTSTNNFTLEGWLNANVVSGSTNIVRCTNNYSIAILVSAGVLVFYLSSNNSSWDIASSVGTGSVSTSTWYHFALVRNSNTFTIYLNGVASGTATSASVVYNNDGFNIGAEQNGSAAGVFNGYITNVRMVVGTAVYTANFTPPTAPLTPITNTKFLLNVNSGSLYADTAGFTNTPKLAGTPTWNALSPFATGLGYKNRTYSWTSSGSITF